ncbi:NAD(P) transhydrogenase subunit alpha [Limimonas halophila]|uniref:NAD(P) transhydrogenase subunit alpha part 1 n=1 Tax=Limimonas halophila TaxID=1082479 RepID=A0A1G7LPV9_9PROT|nr:Re/Si-specific NAD(P)(+) transhydrogenase subunit alpha [Limimonas halophila]SDF51525.1 NAD(P) transhydrogenase subunit alpha [Limimonas halophila]
MKLAIPRERRAGETRVAAVPETVKKLLGLGLTEPQVVVETGAGAGASIPDQAFSDAGATIAQSYKETVAGADVVLKVNRPVTAGEDAEADELADLPKGAVVIAVFDVWQAGGAIQACADAGVHAFAMDLMPRITRAQAMDVLSSQANLAGYRAVIDSAHQFGRAFPLMMTAAGTVPPARVLVMGAGVAGLQAIATAGRMGASVSATDVRPAAKEQVESLAAKFVAVEDEEFKEAESAGGYAKEMSDAYKQKQAQLIAETVPKQDIVITTAQVPGRKAPQLVSAEMVASMKPGSVIADLAAGQGGNVALTEPGSVSVQHGVTILGHTNWPARIPVSASSLYARNLVSFLKLMVAEDGGLSPDGEDQLLTGTRLTGGGRIVHPDFQPSGG